MGCDFGILFVYACSWGWLVLRFVLVFRVRLLCFEFSCYVCTDCFALSFTTLVVGFDLLF